MNHPTLLASIAFALVVAGVYAYTGYRVSQRKVNGDDRMAQNLFVMWWYTLAASSALGVVDLALYLNDALEISMYQTLGQVNLLLIMLALMGLLYYLIYLYTGSRKSLIPLSIFYAIFWLVLVFMTLDVPPETITDNGWNLEAEPNAFNGSMIIVLLIALVGPQMAASVALFRLYFKVEGKTQKYRLGIVSGAIFVWFGAAIFASLTGLAELGWWPIASRIIGLVAALAILAAYVPPKWIREKYGIEAVS